MAGDCADRYTHSCEEWVAVKDKLFEDKNTKMKLLFIVAYNETEGKLAITVRERHRNFTDCEENVRSGIFSFSDLQYIHSQLSLIFPSLERYLPSLPIEPQGLWTLFYTLEIPQTLCSDIENYLRIALEICGYDLLVSILFSEDSVEQYFEDLSELKITGFESAVEEADTELENVLQMRSESESLLSLIEIYKREDEVIQNYNLALAELYNFQLQPFLDLRELSYCKLREAKFQMNNPEVGNRVKSHFAKQFLDWQEQYTKAADNIFELYVKYFTTRVTILTAQCQRMKKDQLKFGKSAFAVCALPRLMKLEENLSEERLQMLYTKKQLEEHKREQAKQRFANVNSRGGNAADEIEHIEADVYKLQIRLFDLKMKIVDEEEILAKKQLQIIQKDIEGSESDVVFYDAVEDLEDLSPEEDAKRDPRVICIKKKLGVVFRKRAQLRNLKKSCIAAWETKTHLKHEEKMANEKQKLDPEKELERKARIEESRKRTLQRLRRYKQKFSKFSSGHAFNADKAKKLQKTNDRTDQQEPKENGVEKDSISAKKKLKKGTLATDERLDSKLLPRPPFETRITNKKRFQQSGEPAHLYYHHEKKMGIGKTFDQDSLSPQTITSDDKVLLLQPGQQPTTKDAFTQTNGPSVTSLSLALAPPPPPPPPPPPSQVNNFPSPSSSQFETPEGHINRDHLFHAKGTLQAPPPKKKENVMDEMFQMIRLGVKLKKVEVLPVSRPPTPTEGGYEQLLQDALNRIRVFTEDSEKSDEEGPNDFD